MGYYSDKAEEVYNKFADPVKGPKELRELLRTVFKEVARDQRNLIMDGVAVKDVGDNVPSWVYRTIENSDLDGNNQNLGG